MTGFGLAQRLCTLAVFALASAHAVPASAAPADCQENFEKLGRQRMTLVQKVQGFQKKKTSATNVCAALNQLSAADAKLISWAEANKDWCQIPDQFLETLKSSSGQISTARGNACSAAKKEAAILRQMKANAAQSQGPSGLPGSGVRLPQGAL